MTHRHSGFAENYLTDKNKWQRPAGHRCLRHLREKEPTDYRETFLLIRQDHVQPVLYYLFQFALDNLLYQDPEDKDLIWNITERIKTEITINL